MIVTLFGLFAEIERTLLSLRTKEALAAARAAETAGTPPGSAGEIKPDGKEQGDSNLIDLGVKGVDC